MNHKRRILIAVILVAMLLTAASGLAWRSFAAPNAHTDAPDGEESGNLAAEAPPDAAVPGGPGFCSVSAHLFMAPDQTTSYVYNAGSVLNNTGASDASFRAGVLLPHGATVNQFVMYYYDDSSAEDLTTNLYRCNLSNNVCGILASVSSTGASTGYRNSVDSSIDYAVIDNQSYIYYVRTVLPGGQGTDLGLLGVRVDYEYSAKHPLVMKNR